MAGYAFNSIAVANVTIVNVYAGVVKNGNKLTLVQYFKITKAGEFSGSDYQTIGEFVVPQAVANLIFPSDIGGGNTCVAMNNIALFYNNTISKIDAIYNINKTTATKLRTLVTGFSQMTAGTTYYGRIEATFLLSENLAA